MRFREDKDKVQGEIKNLHGYSQWIIKIFSVAHRCSTLVVFDMYQPH